MKDNLELTADIPAFIITPYAIKLYKSITGENPDTYKDKHFPGQSDLAEAMGISKHQLANMLGGKQQRIPLDTIDKLCIRGDFNLNDVYETMKEYAQDHPELGWPEKYKPKSNHTNKAYK